jgi:ribonuclease R
MERKKKTITGLYQATGKGYGFLTPEDGGEDYFVPPRHQGGAWHGDQVTAQVELDKGGQLGRGTAQITAVLRRGSGLITGALSRQGREIWLIPDNRKYPGPIQVVGRTAGARAGDKAALAITSYGSAHHAPMGTIREIFGREGSREAAVAALLYQYGVEPEFPEAVLGQAAAIPQQVSGKMLTGRLDLRENLTFTIDGPAAKDLDDAVSLTRDERGRWVLGVHIADVSHYVRAGSPLDLEAWKRGTSVYFADRVVPMLPPALSNGICSLNPQVDRLALSCLMTMSEEGEIVEHTIAQSVIRTAERMNYGDCNRLLAGGDRELEERYAHLLPTLREMGTLARGLARRRRLRGSLDLDSVEVSIQCDENGAPIGVEPHRQGEAEALIESFMLCANECVAEHLFRLQKPAVYRVHEKPTEEKAQGLRMMLAPFGYDLPQMDHYGLQALLKKVEGRPEAGVVHMLVLRSLMKARYDRENLGHFGLAAPYYCHFTSPIRRYPDLMVHRILTALLEGRLEGATEKKLALAAQKAAVQSSQRELAATSAEREIEKRYLAEYMRGHVGEQFPAVVSGVTRFGLFAALENGIEGLIPVESLPDDAYHFDEGRMTLTGEHTRQSYTLGVRLEVTCAAADPASGQIDFQLNGVEPRPRRADHTPPARIPTRKPREKGSRRPARGKRGRRT